MRFARDKQSNALARHSLLDQRIGPRPRPSNSSAQLNWNTRSARQAARLVGLANTTANPIFSASQSGILIPRSPSPAGKRDLKHPGRCVSPEAFCFFSLPVRRLDDGQFATIWPFLQPVPPMSCKPLPTEPTGPEWSGRLPLPPTLAVQGQPVVTSGAIHWIPLLRD